MKQRPWSFFSNHLHVLECLLRYPDSTLQEMAARVEISRRAVQTIINDLIADGYLLRTKEGRRNRYVPNLDAPLRHRLNAAIALREVVPPLIQPTARRSPRSRSPQTLRVLLIGDQALVREALATELRTRGCEVVTAALGREGLPDVERFAAEIIVLDLHVTVTEGEAFIAPYRGRAPMVLLTAAPDVEAAALASEIGASRVVSRNDSPDVLHQTLTRLRLEQAS